MSYCLRKPYKQRYSDAFLEKYYQEKYGVGTEVIKDRLRKRGYREEDLRDELEVGPLMDKLWDCYKQLAIRFPNEFWEEEPGSSSEPLNDE